MKLLGYKHVGHDANAAIYDDGPVEYFCFERITGIKHASCSHEDIVRLCRARSFRPDAVCYTLPHENFITSGFPLFEKRVETFADTGAPVYFIDHHFAHLLSSWPLVDLSHVDVGIVIDGSGNHDSVSTVFRRSGNSFTRVQCERRIGKSIGKWFERVGRRVFPDRPMFEALDFAGKLMGAHAYGTVDWDYVKSADPDTVFNHDLRELSIDWRFEVPEFRNWLATHHKLVELNIMAHFRRHCKPDELVVYTGGCALNTVINNALHTVWRRLVIPPHSNDSGVSLGCIELLRQVFNLPAATLSGFPYCQQDEERRRPSVATIERVAELLADGKIVGWFQGRGEIGPRALGDRSILMSPTARDGKARLNEKVKKREHWRPYGSSVLVEHYRRWFDADEPSPYMLIAVPVRVEKQQLIPAVVHVDGTSRIQTVSKEQNLLYHQLLEAFYQLTGVPMLLNTSLNMAGEPMYATREQCLRLLQVTGLDAICMGDRLETKLQRSPRPADSRGWSFDVDDA